MLLTKFDNKDFELQIILYYLQKSKNHGINVSKDF